MARSDSDGGSSSEEELSISEEEADSLQSAALADDMASEQSAATASDLHSERSAATAASSGSEDGGGSETEDGGGSEAEDAESEDDLPGGSPGSPSDLSASAHLSSSSSAGSSDGFCLWELCCAPDSELVAAVKRAGAEGQRLTLETGFDFQSPEAARRAKRLIASSRKFRRGWASPPCTKWSSLQNLTKKTPKRAQELKRARRKSRRLIGNCVEVLLAIAKKGGHFYYEWPHSCQGWHIPELRHLRRQAQKLQLEVFEVVFEGCAFGLRDSSGQLFLRKRWRVMTNDPGLAAVARRCPFQGRDGPAHRHKTIEGAETARSAFYPPQLCRALARYWQRHGQQNG